jgi:uncharacterized lipoprotein NlpE involved in copper resistance
MKLKTIISLIVLTLTLLSCNAKEENKTINQEAFINKTPIDSVKEKLTIVLERGAFHYDSFTVKDSILNYIPEGNLRLDKENSYSNPVEITITKEQRKELIDLINSQGFWSYKKEYKAISSCTSGTSVSVALGDKKITIVSDDYKWDCPKGLLLLEQKLIELTGKDLQRINLPG